MFLKINRQHWGPPIKGPGCCWNLVADPGIFKREAGNVAKVEKERERLDHCHGIYVLNGTKRIIMCADKLFLSCKGLAYQGQNMTYLHLIS